MMVRHVNSVNQQCIPVEKCLVLLIFADLYAANVKEIWQKEKRDDRKHYYHSGNMRFRV